MTSAKTEPNAKHAAEEEEPTGPRWGVSLYMQFPEDDAADQLEAVERFLEETLRKGMREFTFTVRDRHTPEGTVYFVEDNEVLTYDEYNDKLAAEHELEEDEEDEDDDEAAG